MVTLVEDQQLIDWLAVLGLPVAEPSWAVVPVGGASKWVLMQPYERRVVTYTPDNDAAYRVEMGNIGEHYRTWRHPDGTCAERAERAVAPSAPSAPPAEPVPAAVNNGIGATVSPPSGTERSTFVMTIAALEAGEPVGIWFTDPDGEVWYPASRQISLPKGVAFSVGFVPKDTFSEVTPGIWAFTAQGVNSGKSGVAYFRITGDAPAPAPAPAPGPAPAPAADYSGSWSGQTSKSEAISFSVSNGQVTGLTFKLVTDRRCTITITAAPDSRFPITGQTFKGAMRSSGGSVYAINGVFNSATSAEGTINYVISDEAPQACRGEGANGWRATKK